jgi:hypothetical protein
MVPNEVPTRTSVVQFDPRGFMRVTHLPGAEETLADAQQTVRVVLSLSAGRRMPLLVNMRGMKSQDRDARQYYGSPDVTHAATAVALLVESRVSMLIANFFINVTKINVPTKIFTDEVEALTWLKAYIQ